jgi:hypothetical protein
LLVVRHGDSLAGRSAWRFFGDLESIGRFERYLRYRPILSRMSANLNPVEGSTGRFWADSAYSRSNFQQTSPSGKSRLQTVNE